MKLLALVISIFLLNNSCRNDIPHEYVYNRPPSLNDGLYVGTPEEVKMDSQLILKAAARIKDGKYGAVHSMLIYKDDRLVFEEYFPGYRYKWDAPYYIGEPVQWDLTMKHQIMSCTKSVTSACINIAIEKGFIKNVNQSIFDYLTDYHQFDSGLKSEITIEHLLTMTSGLSWDEWHAPHATAANDIDRLYIECSDDVLKCVLEKPVVSTPGSSFTYNGGGIITLGEILKNASGMDIKEFSERYLFSPLGVDSIQWDGFPDGELETAGGLHLRPRDMLKFGVMYLNRGVWNGERIISQDWVAKSAEIYANNSGIKIPIEDSGRNGYGYTWWISRVGHSGAKTKMYRANGWGGQVIMVLPEKRIVVVFTGGNYTSKSHLFKIIEQFILPSVNDHQY
jgi:CubicO group peptidase (beta-lactamase class C family)